MTLPRHLLTLAFTAVAALAPSLATAQPAPAVAAVSGEGTSTEYRFLDDDLLGGGLDGTSPIIRVNPRATRSLLIRPRTSFVPELLLSADGF